MKACQPQFDTSSTPTNAAPNWDQAFEELFAKYKALPFVALNPLYSLPSNLLERLEVKIPGFLKSEEILFEEDLFALCQRYHAVGIFHGRPIYDSALTMPAMPSLSVDEFVKLGWTAFNTVNKVNAAIRLGGQRLDPLRKRLDAYRGWLVTNPEYLNDRDELRNRWEAAINEIRYIPVQSKN